MLDEGYEAAPEGATRVAAAGNAFFADVVDFADSEDSADQKYFTTFDKRGIFKVRNTSSEGATRVAAAAGNAFFADVRKAKLG